MPDFLAATPEAYASVSPGFVETLIQSRRAELFTGLMRLRYPSEAVFIFSFHEGVQQKLYRCLEQSTEVIPRQSWMDSLNRANAFVSFMPMTVEGMRLMQVAFEAPVSEIRGQTLTLPQLAEQVHNWAKSREPAILQVHADQTHRIYLISGVYNPVIEGVMFANADASFSLNDASFPTLLQPGEYEVTRYVSDHQHIAWQAHELRLAFNPLMRLLLNRFSELAGRRLTERLCERMSGWLHEERCNITVTLNGVSNHHYFESFERAAETYWGMVRCFHDAASPAIGQRMAEGLSFEALSKLDLHRREIITRYIFNESHVDTVTGRVWR